jgi:hypothetical protein
MKDFPVKGQIYTVRDIYNLALTDTPSLMFKYQDAHVPIQQAHVTVDQLLSMPGFADVKFRYSHTTWLETPIFLLCEDEEIFNFVNVESVWDDVFEEHDVWVTPKEFPREYR